MPKNNRAKRQKSDSSAESMFVYTGVGCTVPKDVVRVQFDSSVVEVAKDAFRHCIKLRVVEFNKGLKAIGGYAFAGCDSLQKYHFPL